MERFRIEYSTGGAERIRENLRRGAVENAFEDVCIKTDRSLQYLTRFLREFEYAQGALSSKMDSICCRIDELRKNGQETGEYQAYLARLRDIQSQNEYRLKEIREAIGRLTDFREAMNRALFWSKELSASAVRQICALMDCMDRYMSADAEEPDLLHRQVTPIRKLTEGGV